MVGRLLSFGEGLFSGAMFVLGRVHDMYTITYSRTRRWRNFQKGKIYIIQKKNVPIEIVCDIFNPSHFEEPFFSPCADRKTAEKEFNRNMQRECLSLLASQSLKHSHCASVMGMPKCLSGRFLRAYNTSTQLKQSAKTYDNCRRHLRKTIVTCLLAYTSSTQSKQSAKTCDDCRGHFVKSL